MKRFAHREFAQCLGGVLATKVAEITSTVMRDKALCANMRFPPFSLFSLRFPTTEKRMTMQDQHDTGQPVEGTEASGDAVIEETTTTERTEVTPPEPSTAAQDVVDEAHEQLADNSTVVEESTTTETHVVEEGANPSPPSEGTDSQDD